MSSTGYLVEGWQVDPTTGDIRKDTVSALRVMQASNVTSPPEATTNANVSGVIDKNDTNVNSDSGYAMSLSFYDNLGYQYTAKFAFRAEDPDTGTFNVELTNIYDSDNNDILASWMAEDATHTIDKIFGVNRTATRNYKAGSQFTHESDGGLSIVIDGKKYKSGTNIKDDLTLEFICSDVSPSLTKTYKLEEIYGVSESFLKDTTKHVTYEMQNGNLHVTYDAVNYKVKFKESDGSFEYIGYESTTPDDNAERPSQNLNVDLLGQAFKTIDVNFQNSLNYDNGGTSTLAIDKGDITGTQGVGKKLGTMTGLSVDGTGRIYGSYDNGNTVLLGQIAVAQFANASGLEATGNSCYRTTLNSGDFDGIGVEVTADGGSMNTGQLEMSNVDLSAEFTDMITTQRGFQANSRVITTSDTMLEELVNLKR